MTKSLNIFVVVIFGTLLSLPFLNDTFHLVHFERKNENRKFNDSLTLSIKHLDNFPKDAEAYLSDNFSFRSPLITFSKDFKLNYLGVSPDKNAILIGKKERYFLATDHRDVYEGFLYNTQEWLDSLEQEWVYRKHFLDSLGIPVKIILAPIAHEIYPEEIPFYIVRRTGKDPITLITTRLNKRYPNLVYNPIPFLLANKKREHLYFNLDNHWSDKGGFLVAQEFLKQLKKDNYPNLDLSSLNAFTWKTENRKFGYFVNVLASTKLSETVHVIDKRPLNVETLPLLPLNFNNSGISEDLQQVHFRVKGCKNKLRVLVIRDSFGEALIPALSSCFAETVFLFDSWDYRLNKSVITAYKPDLIIYVTYETLLKSYTTPENWEH